MAILSSLIVFALLLVSVTGIRCNADSIAAEREIEELKSKIASLESTCLYQEKEIKEKGKRQSDLEINIQENSAQIASLSSEIDLLQKKGNSDDDELISKTNAHHYMLQKQIEMLESELETQVQKREALEAKANAAETTTQKLSQKLECVEKINVGQRQKIEEINQNLQHVQDELRLAKANAKSQANELQKVNGAWLPHWLARHINPLKNLMRRYMELHMQIAYSKTSDVYEVCVDAMTPHYIKVKQGFESYLHEIEKLFQPYIVQVKRTSKPYATKVHLIFEPYKKRAIGPFNMYLHKVRTAIYENLKKHELFGPIATEKFSWILVSLLFCVPLIFLYKLVSSIFSKKRKRSRPSRGGDHLPRKQKRRHIEK